MRQIKIYFYLVLNMINVVRFFSLPCLTPQSLESPEDNLNRIKWPLKSN